MSRRSEKKDNQQNSDNFTEEAQTLGAKKAGIFPPNLNGINKNEQQ